VSWLICFEKPPVHDIKKRCKRCLWCVYGCQRCISQPFFFISLQVSTVKALVNVKIPSFKAAFDLVCSAIRSSLQSSEILSFPSVSQYDCLDVSKSTPHHTSEIKCLTTTYLSYHSCFNQASPWLRLSLDFNYPNMEGGKILICKVQFHWFRQASFCTKRIGSNRFLVGPKNLSFFMMVILYLVICIHIKSDFNHHRYWTDNYRYFIVIAEFSGIT